jgi:hypothetical protein
MHMTTRTSTPARWVGVAALVLAGCSASATTSNAPSAPSPSDGASPSPSPQRETARPTTVPLADEGTMVAGTYSTHFQPRLTLTIGREVDLDCAAGYRCQGDIDVNTASWLDLEFGNAHGSEFSVLRLDPLSDPGKPATVTEPPGDLAGWISALPDVSVIEGPTSVSVGGVDAVQLDVRTAKDVGFAPPGLNGPFPQWGGLPAAHEARLVFLRIDGHAIMLTEQIGPENTVHDFAAAIAGLQDLVDSISWE